MYDKSEQKFSKNFLFQDSNPIQNEPEPLVLSYFYYLFSFATLKPSRFCVY